MFNKSKCFFLKLGTAPLTHEKITFPLNLNKKRISAITNLALFHENNICVDA